MLKYPVRSRRARLGHGCSVSFPRYCLETWRGHFDDGFASPLSIDGCNINHLANRDCQSI